MLRASIHRTVLMMTLLLLCAAHHVHAAAGATLDIYFIDTEGGAATLIVTPAGESLLIDAGNPGDRDAARIAHVARDLAKLKRIDHCIITHYHSDHFGGIPPLVKLIPVTRFYDHGAAPDPLPKDINPELMRAYRRATNDDVAALKPDDRIAFRRARGTPAVTLRVVASNGIVPGEQPGAPQTRECGINFNPRPDDATDNHRSVAFVLSFGDFKFFSGGDLTWNTEHRLACPKNIVGAVDVYQVDHHGMDTSNNPSLVAALRPRVAVINNGARKGGRPGTYNTLVKTPSIRAIYQLHRNVTTTDADNTARPFIANEEEACEGNFIKIVVDPKSRTYTTHVHGKAASSTYRFARNHRAK